MWLDELIFFMASYKWFGEHDNVIIIMLYHNLVCITLFQLRSDCFKNAGPHDVFFCKVYVLNKLYNVSNCYILKCFFLI